jgi:hypothetical protein
MAAGQEARPLFQMETSLSSNVIVILTSMLLAGIVGIQKIVFNP